MTWTRQQRNKSTAERVLDGFPTKFMYKGVVYHKEVPATTSCCGQASFIADTKGVIDRPLSYPEGTYIVTVTKKEG